MNIARHAVTLSIATLILAVAGCAIVKETYMPDGSKGYSISCDGAAVGINVCFEKAGDLCGASGYDLITREGQIIPFGVSSASVYGTPSQIQGQSFATYGSFNSKSIMIRPEAHAPHPGQLHRYGIFP